MRYKPVFIETTKKTVAGPIDDSYLSKLTTLGYLLYKIPYEHTFRPDLISFLFYGDVKYSQEISLYNNFKFSPQDYYTYRLIKIPDPKEVRLL
jgi:hypothetical protein